MNLRRRLVIANAAAVIVPLAITVFAALAFAFVLNHYTGANVSMENYQQLYKIHYELMENRNGILKQSPEMIEDKDFQDYLLQKLSAIGGELVVIKGDAVVFSSRLLTKVDLAKFLEPGASHWGRKPLVIENTSYAVQIAPIDFKHNITGKVILLAPLEYSGPDLVYILLGLGMIYILAFIATNIVITYQMTRGISRPINLLQKAAFEIRNGNLDYQITEEGDNEIQELCRDLELMRIRLKDSVNLQLKYEDNRKMLISSISHDLKTPVTSIKGYVEGILDGVATTPEKVEKYLKTIYFKANQVDRMIDDLLLYAKLDLKQIPFNFTPIDIACYLQDVLDESDPEFRIKGVALEVFNHLSRQYVLSLDLDRMRRVITNILDNSLKYMAKDNGRIAVFLRDTPSSVIIEFRDNGSGISEEDLPYVFERFYRSDASRHEVKGSGLGLAIAKQIVEGHDGRIWAVSHGQEGTSIMISLRKT